MVYRIFNLDLHIGPIRDFTAICEQLYGKNQVEVVSWSISGHKHLLSNPTGDIDIVNQETWSNIDETMIEQWTARYGWFMVQFDAFFVSHSPVFAMLYECYKKPIIINNTCRYDLPYCWTKKPNNLDEALRRMTTANQLIIVSNNLNDARYLHERTGITSHVIPSICMYLVPHRLFDARAVCFGNRLLFPGGDWMIAKPENYTYRELFNYKCIVHVPYEMSTMSIAEQYWNSVPLFLPTKRFYKECVLSGRMQFICMYGQQATVKDLDTWIEGADFYNWKYINYYDSFEDCQNLVMKFTDPLRGYRLKYLTMMKEKIMDAWKQIIPVK
jgi:hypothetical protein